MFNETLKLKWENLISVGNFQICIVWWEQSSDEVWFYARPFEISKTSQGMASRGQHSALVIVVYFDDFILHQVKMRETMILSKVQNIGQAMTLRTNSMMMWIPVNKTWFVNKMTTHVLHMINMIAIGEDNIMTKCTSDRMCHQCKSKWSRWRTMKSTTTKKNNICSTKFFNHRFLFEI